MSFAKRAIAVSFRLGQGSFGDSGFDTIKLTGQLRASARVSISGGPAMAQLDLSVYGMTLDHMNKLATMGPILNVEGTRNNEVIVEAGDTTNGLGVVFQGTIREASFDFSGMPNCSFRIQAFTGTMLALRPVQPTSYNGLSDVATIFASLAKQGQVTFQNNGVTAQLIDPYFPGTIWDQMESCAKSAGINWVHDAQSNAVVIWPKNGSRGGAIPVVSASTGLIGYPSFSNLGIICNCLYSPNISIGQIVKVESTLTLANGQWTIKTVNHSLESETPGGQWSTNFLANPDPNSVVIKK